MQDARNQCTLTCILLCNTGIPTCPTYWSKKHNVSKVYLPISEPVGLPDNFPTQPWLVVLKFYRDVKPNRIIGHGAGGSIFFESSTFYICISTYNYLVLIYIYSYNPSSTMRYVDIASKNIINSYFNRFQVQLWKLKK